MTADDIHFGARARRDWEDRSKSFPKGFAPAVVAIDGPLIADSAPPPVRAVERLLSQGAFARRCKPAFSHFGQGLDLRRAAGRTRDDARAAFPGAEIVEAFPNAFLGVMLDDACFAGMPPLKRGRKFDWLFDCAAERGLFECLLDHIGVASAGLGAAIGALRDHEIRSAYICLLTALCCALGKARPVGDAAGGCIMLPPEALWAGWARDAVNRADSGRA